MTPKRPLSRKPKRGGRPAARFRNSYEDTELAAAYSTLEFARTYYLAFRDLPRIIVDNVNGKRALDFGCGAGRSTRFLKGLGLDVVGIDISQAMITIARKSDPKGDYRLVQEGDFSQLEKGASDLVLSAFTFDNIPTTEMKVRILCGLSDLLSIDGRIINLVSSPEMYTHEWASFCTKDYPENRSATSGDVVRIITKDHADHRPVEDILCTDESYRRIYRHSKLEVLGVSRPLATGEEPYEWGDETRIAPWVIYVLGREVKRPPDSGLFRHDGIVR